LITEHGIIRAPLDAGLRKLWAEHARHF
jgi:hypothetical protein